MNITRLLLTVSQKGDWKAWLTFFLNGVRQQSEDALATIQKLLDLQKQYRAGCNRSKSAEDCKSLDRPSVYRSYCLNFTVVEDMEDAVSHG